jgi:hypothetical protein
MSRRIRAVYFFTIIAFMVMLHSCEKEISVDLPIAEEKIVVEGNIFPNRPPTILLTWSSGYFEPTDLSTLQNIFVHDADVKIRVNNITYPLQEICSSELTPQDLELAASFLGVPVETLQALDICLYTNLSLFGEAGQIYSLEINKGTHRITGETRIPELVELDSLWFEIVSVLPDDSLGFIFGTITDPDTAGNAYRWYAQRINQYPDWIEDEDLRGTQKDFGFIAPLGSVFDDTFFNGLSFEFGYYRGTEPNSTKFDDLNAERGFFKRGDTVAVRGCTIDRNAYKFLYSFESQVSNQGSPFAVPFNLEYNVEGGLGAFIGYGAVYDTVICN